MSALRPFFGRRRGPAHAAPRAVALALAVAVLLGPAGCVTRDPNTGQVFIGVTVPTNPEVEVLPERQEIDVASAALARKDFDTAERILVAAVDRRRGNFRPGDTEGASLLVLLAETYLRKGNFEQALSVATRAMVIADPTGPLSEPGSQRSAHYRLGRGYEAAGLDAEAEEHYYKALQVCQDDPEYEGRSACNTERSALVRIFVATGRYKEAEPLVLQRVASAQAAFGSYDIRLAQALGEAAEFYSRQGKYNLSQPLFARGLAIWQDAHDEAVAAYRQARETGSPNPLGSDATRPRPGFFPLTAPLGLEDQSTTLIRLNRADEAARAAELEKELWTADADCEQSALDAFARVNASDSLEYVTAMETVAYAYFKKGRYARAEGYYKNALVRMEAIWSQLDALSKRESQDAYLESYDNLAIIARAARRYRDAVKLYEKAAIVASRGLDKHDSRYLDQFANLSTVYREMGELQSALDYAGKYYERLREARPPDSPDRAWALRNIAYIYFLRGDAETSQRLEAKALEVWAAAEATDGPPQEDTGAQPSE